MLYNLVQTRRGKETVVMTDQLPKVRDRMKTLRKSQRKGIKKDKVIYAIIPTEEFFPFETTPPKYRKKPHSESWRAGGGSEPRRVK